VIISTLWLGYIAMGMATLSALGVLGGILWIVWIEVMDTRHARRKEVKWAAEKERKRNKSGIFTDKVKNS
jgi:hypothetical protein